MNAMPKCERFRLLAVVAFCASLVLGCSRNDLNVPEVTEKSGVLPPQPTAERVVSDMPIPAFYSVSLYDEERDPAADLADTLRRANAENKRVLLQVGGNWCGWCIKISKYMETNQRVHELVDKNFVVMKVTYPGKHAKEFLAQYPSCNGYPHFFVLGQDGTFLHLQQTGELEKGEGYDEEEFVQFLTSWAP